MVSLFGIDMTPGIEAIKDATGDLFARANLGGGPSPLDTFQPAGRDPFAGLRYGGGTPFDNLSFGGASPFDRLVAPSGASPLDKLDMGMAAPLGGRDFGRGDTANPFDLFAGAKQKADQRQALDEAQAAQTKNANGAIVEAGAGTASAGLAPGVARWADQAKAVFGDIDGLDPDTMLAIMTNESGGDPNAYNAAGNAYGLFQQVGLGSNDPNVQFQAAHQLAQEKMRAINAAYAAHGLNPDARTRARDFALAWAGHFDYDTGQPNPSSRDIGSGQTADQLSNIFLSNYDKIKQGRAQAAATGNAAGGYSGVVAAGAKYLGAPYELGGYRNHPGNPMAGIDCSEFTAKAYKDAYGIDLPWNAQMQYDNTQRVDASNLQVGDLVFFQGTYDTGRGEYITHVGIYAGNGKMINASSDGVSYQDLNSPYWKSHYAGAGRVNGGGGGGNSAY